MRAGRLVAAGKIGRAAQRILGPSGVAHLYDVEAARALRQLHRIRDVTLTAGDHTVTVTTRRDALQQRILAVLHVDTTGWNRARTR